MPDRITALVTLLAEDSTVAEIAEGRVFDSELPDNQVPRMPRPCIVVRAAGGIDMASTQELSQGRVDILCYGWTPTTARGLYEVVHTTLSQMLRTGVGDTLLHWARRVGGPNQLREPSEGWPGGAPDNRVHWPLVASTWQVQAADIPIPV